MQQLVLVNHKFVSLKEAKKIFRKMFKYSKFTKTIKQSF